MDEKKVFNTDVVIFGGGIAGLWLLASLRKRGYQTLLLEREQLGAGQTLYAQGIIHGGMKYALAGKLTGASEAIHNMPQIWRDCLQGEGELDLSGALVLSECQYMWSPGTLTGKIAGFFAQRMMQSRVESLDKDVYPAALQTSSFSGQVYKLQEPVLDTLSVIKALAQPVRESIGGYDTFVINESEDAGFSRRITVKYRGGDDIIVQTKKVILAAGQGSSDLLPYFGMTKPQMQLRPVHMVAVRGELPADMFAHCLGVSDKPRVTITSHRDNVGNTVWYLGGQLAEEGVTRSPLQQVEAAKQELRNLLPHIKWNATQWTTFLVNRAEAQQPGGARPDDCYVEERNNIIVTWPTKMAFAPRVSCKVVELLEKTISLSSNKVGLTPLIFPGYAELPWNRSVQWN